MANRLAIIQNGAVLNVIIAGPTWSPPDGCEVVVLAEGSPVGPGWLYDGNSFAEPAPVAGNPVMSRLAFMRRFSAQERIAIRITASTDPILADVQELMNLAQEIDLNDSDTIMALGYMTQLGLVTKSRAAEILNP